MRPSILALLVLCAVAPRAQTAEHVRLADAVIEAADLSALMQGMMGPMTQIVPGDLDQMFAFDAVEDSMRARLIADGRTDALREVLAFLESPANATLTAHGQELAERMSDPAEMLAFQMQVAEPDESALADEALVRRYQRAQGTSEWMPEMMTRMFEAIAEAAPEFGAMMKAEGGMSEMFDDENLREFTESQVAAMRVALYGVPEQALVEAIDFAESDPGRYFTEVGVAVTTDVMIPAMVAFMAPMFAGLAPPDAPPSDGVEVFDVAEVQPELIGGVDALAEAIVYPEDARAEDVEGRVIVQFIVDTKGAVTEAVVVRSPDDRLSRAALAAVRAQRFTPGKVDGQLVRVRFSLPVSFRLGEGGVARRKIPAGAAIYRNLDRVQAAAIYPESAREDGVAGEVTLRIVLDREGTLVEAEVVRSPDPRLSEAALAAVRSVTFEPLDHGLEDSDGLQPITFSVSFGLDGE